MTATRLAIAGAGGRMGQILVEATLASPDLVLVSAFDLNGSPSIGRDAGERFGRAVGVVVGDDPEEALRDADVLIDFTRPEGTLKHLAACARRGAGAVVGTTGFTDAQQLEIVAFAHAIPLVFSPNMSVGVNVLLKLVELGAKGLGAGFDIEIVEMHHRSKVDAPSGTALRLGEAAAAGAGISLADAGVYSRQGVTGPRLPGSIGFATLRGGDVIGEHTVIFAGAGERVELSHIATSRQNFAAGALRAARYVAARRTAGRPGLADMQDVLGLAT